MTCRTITIAAVALALWSSSAGAESWEQQNRDMLHQLEVEKFQHQLDDLRWQQQEFENKMQNQQDELRWKLENDRYEAQQQADHDRNMRDMDQSLRDRR